MYQTRKYFMSLYSIGETKTDTLIKEIENCSRYPKNSVIRDTRLVRVDTDVFADYIANRRQIRDKVTSKFLKPYRKAV